jgi:hypothetical protein
MAITDLVRRSKNALAKRIDPYVDRKIVKRYLHIATDIVHKLPDRNDNWLKIAVKLLAIADSFDKTHQGTNSQLFEFFSNLDAETARNAQFVDTFFETPLGASFDLRRIMISDYADVVIANDAELGSLYFIEYKWGPKPEPSTDFWHSKGFNFEKALERLWGFFHGGIQVSLKFEANRDRPRTDYRDLVFTKDPIVGKNTETLRELVEDHLQYKKAGVSRTYLFLGMQGVGKSTLAGRMAQANGQRTLRIDARGMTVAGTNDMHFLLTGLKPDFLILDDVDRVVSDAIPMMLEGLTNLKERHPNVTTILTANDITPFDTATLRPGRIDVIVEFEPPNEAERAQILSAYMQEFSSKPLTRTEMQQVIKATAGYSGAYLREVAIELRVASASRVIATQKQRKRLTEKAGKSPKGLSTTAAPQPTAKA